MGVKIFYVKGKIAGGSGWSGSPVRLTADDHLAAEREAKKLFAAKFNVSTSEIDVQAVRWDTKTTFKPRIKKP